MMKWTGVIRGSWRQRLRKVNDVLERAFGKDEIVQEWNERLSGK